MSELSLPVQLAMIRELEDRIKKAKESVKRQLLAEMQSGDSLGANVGEVRVGRVTYVDGAVSVYVADSVAFLDWVEQNSPDQVVRQVSPDHTQRVLNLAKASGELPPGVEVQQGGPYLTYRPAKGADVVVGELWRQHGVELLQIDGGA